MADIGGAVAGARQAEADRHPGRDDRGQDMAGDDVGQFALGIEGILQCGLILDAKQSARNLVGDLQRLGQHQGGRTGFDHADP